MKRIYFNEVVTRDGFQIEPSFIPTDNKVALIDALSQCGYAKIEVTSFVSPKAIPMLRDAEEVMARIQRVAGVEYTVLVPNVRGSAGYGKSYLLLDNGMKRKDSVKDIGSLLDWIARQPELDAKRVGVTGGSYGGYMVLASLVHYGDRLRGGIDVVGISNFVTFLNNTSGYRRDLRRAEYGDERDPSMRAFLQRISPLNRAETIRKPLLVVQGLNDPRVPASESAQLVARVRGSGGEVWYLAAKDEGHGFRKKANRDFYLKTAATFLEKLKE